VHVVETRKPSPFAASLLFSYVANFLYDGDAPLAERRAQALTIDQDQLRELLGEADLRELLDADAIAKWKRLRSASPRLSRAFGRWHSRSLPASRRSCRARNWRGAWRRSDLLRMLTAWCVRAVCSNCALPASAVDCGRRCGPLSRWAGNSVAAGLAVGAAGAGRASGAGTGAPLCAHAWAVHAARGCGSFCAGRCGRKCAAPACCRKAACSKAVSVPAAFIASGAMRRCCA
jgi:hypothetical protein